MLWVLIRIVSLRHFQRASRQMLITQYQKAIYIFNRRKKMLLICSYRRLKRLLWFAKCHIKYDQVMFYRHMQSLPLNPRNVNHETNRQHSSPFFPLQNRMSYLTRKGKSYFLERNNYEKWSKMIFQGFFQQFWEKAPGQNWGKNDWLKIEIGKNLRHRT